MADTPDAMNPEKKDHHASFSGTTVPVGSDEDVTPGSTEALMKRLSVRAPSSSHHEVQDELAVGGMGRVLRVWDENLRRSLAMKVIIDRSDNETPEPLEVEPQILARFVEEAQITGQLQHPGIVPVHEFGINSEGRVYFTMPLVKGINLKTVLNEVREGSTKWTQERLVDIVLKVCETMAYAHSKSVLHRDLKPSNVMVGKFGEVYVMDWGLAKVLSSDSSPDPPELGSGPSTVTMKTGRSGDDSDSSLRTMDGEVVGTPAYMSPEQARGDHRKIGPQSDVYAVGAMLYSLLTGAIPYSLPEGRRTPRTILNCVLEGAPTSIRELRPEAPPELVAICEKAMARSTDDRYRDMMEVAEDLRSYLEGRVVRAYAAGAAAQLRKWMQRNKGAAFTAAALLILLLVSAGTIAWLQGDAAERIQNSYEQLAEEKEAGERLRDVMSSRALLSQASEIYPPAPAGELWVSRVKALLEKREAYQTLSRAAVLPGPEITRTELLTMLGDIDELETRLEAYQQYLVAWHRMEKISLDDHADAWKQARHEIANLAAYGGLSLPPQRGLVPLRQNPETELWEFWHVLSGERPVADPGSGHWVIAPETGIVLVLVPGGRFTLGSPAGERGRNPATEAMREVDVPPFFCSAHEVTQGQWQRIEGQNPSYYPVGTVKGTVTVSEHHPVEFVSWDDATRFARDLDLALPTEVQWEYGCRAGTRTAYHWGDSPASLEGKENVADLDLQAISREPRAHVNWHDGFPVHAPVGSYTANAFGLWDMHGNVHEWCRDPSPRRPANRIVRGGSFLVSPISCRSSFRGRKHPSTPEFMLGFRLARDVRP